MRLFFALLVAIYAISIFPELHNVHKIYQLVFPTNHTIKVERLKISLKNWPSELNGFKIVQLSDFHYDNFSVLPKHILEQAIQETNNENPDLIALTGDFVDREPKLATDLAYYLKDLRSKYGIFAVLGSHDYSKPNGKEMVTNALQQIANITVLQNSATTIKELGDLFYIVGLGTLLRHEPETEFQPQIIMNTLNASIPRIVLSHDPDTAETLKKYRVDLQLSGHTHGGQICFPGTKQAMLPLTRYMFPQFVRKLLKIEHLIHVVKHWEWSQGFFELKNVDGETNNLYVNRGLGSHLKIRLSCPPEVTVLNIFKSEM